MRGFSLLALALAAFGTARGQTQYTATGVEDVAKARATAKTFSPTSHVPGKTFDRFVCIFLENTDFKLAATEQSIAELAKQGVTLTDYHGVIHPSQPNYIAAVGGSTHWHLLDTFKRFDKSERTIVDLLEAKGISWGEYQEDMPYSGFQGNYVNQKNGKNDYVRKHNPLMSYDSVTSVEDRLAKIKNFTMFESDLKDNKLPQWMFITPNMTNDGHDSDIMTAGTWAKGFLEPLLANKSFQNNTLVILTFDETANYLSSNNVFALLLGDAVTKELHGTKDDRSYNHYSLMATVEKNWDLGNLGLGDEKAAPFF